MISVEKIAIVLTVRKVLQHKWLRKQMSILKYVFRHSSSQRFRQDGSTLVSKEPVGMWPAVDCQWRYRHGASERRPHSSRCVGHHESTGDARRSGENFTSSGTCWDLSSVRIVQYPNWNMIYNLIANCIWYIQIIRQMFQLQRIQYYYLGISAELHLISDTRSPHNSILFIILV